MLFLKKLHIFAILCFLVLAPFCCVYGYADNDGFNDGIDRNAEDFIQVSLLVADPSGILYSVVGHCALRLECPTFNLDYVFSYEGEQMEGRTLQFFLGNLKMGLFAIPTQEYLEDYRKEKRGVRMYHLNLPPEAEQRLWEQMDKRLSDGISLPYDYISRGCALSTSMFIRQALDTIAIDYGHWDEYNYHTIREQFCRDNLQEAQWSRWIISAITGTNVDREVAPEDMIVRPYDLRNVWLRAKIQGHPLMDNNYEELVPSGEPLCAGWVTPTLVACLLLLLAIGSIWIKMPIFDYTLLALQTILGVFVFYMVFFSTIPNNDWNWLVVVFNPLPLITWYWRKYANYVWAGIDILWVIALALSPHHLTDPANLIFILAFSVVILKQTNIFKFLTGYEKD